MGKQTVDYRHAVILSEAKDLNPVARRDLLSQLD